MSQMIRGRHWLATLPFALLMAVLSASHPAPSKSAAKPASRLESSTGLSVALVETSNLRREILILTKDGKTRMIPVALLLQETDP